MTPLEPLELVKDAIVELVELVHVLLDLGGVRGLASPQQILGRRVDVREARSIRVQLAAYRLGAKISEKASSSSEFLLSNGDDSPQHKDAFLYEVVLRIKLHRLMNDV